MRYLIAAIWISVSLLACDDRDPSVGADNRVDERIVEGGERIVDSDEQTEEGDQRTEEGDQRTDEGEQQPDEGEQQPDEGEQQPNEGEQRTEEGDRARLLEMRQEIDTLIGDAAAATIADCRSTALGSKPCGGPWAYIVYSASSTDPTELASRLAEYNAFEAEMNVLYGYVSDCSIPNEPDLVLKDGRCGTE